jgi:CubicO group peptidase (beta-lactamase class C family)
LVLRLVLVAGLARSSPAAGPAVWPGTRWQTATPESQGLSPRALDAAAAYAEKSGGSGCVIRRGYLVKEWGDPHRLADVKSATKGTVGTTLLGLAVDRGLVGLDDRAAKYAPTIGTERPENPRDRLAEITVRQLATMTAGFDDGRPPRLAYRPGTGGIYSNDGANMLAELLTLRFNEDLAAVFKREVMDPIGAPPSDWRWRENAYRTRTIQGLKSREFASGLTITHRAMARIGYLYLRGGEWNGRRVLSQDFIRTAIRPTDLPAFVPYYAFYWGSNGRRTFPGMPDDAYWAFGLGDSFVVVCPSLDIVAVRLGVGSLDSQLPGGHGPEDWGGRVEGFFRLVAAAVETNQTGGAAHPPYPPSPAIRAVQWAPASTIIRKAKGSDNWPITWGDDGHLYTAYGDGNGFEPHIHDRLSLGLARVEGGPADFIGRNFRSTSGEQIGDGRAGKKASGMLMVDGVLYLWARNAGNAQLAWSTDRGATWQWSDWRFTTSFGCPTFLNFGRDYAGARDDYVYVYSHDDGDAYRPADRMVLARVPKDRIKDGDAYEFFERRDARNRPTWTVDIDRRGAVFKHPGRCYRSGISYDAGLKRYLWCQVLPGGDPRFRGGFGIYDAPEPWGPWTTASFTEAWDVGPGETCSFPTKWMSADGRTVHLVFSGEDCFSVRRAVLVTSIRPGASPRPDRGAGPGD